MANKLKAETLALDVVVNANEAQKNINKLGREITDASSRVKDLQNQQALLAKEGKKDSEAYRELTKEIKLNRDRVKELKDEQGKLINSLSLEQKTISQLQRQLTDLRRLRNNSIPGSEQYIQYAKQIEIVSARLGELQIGSEQTGNSIDKLSGRFKGWVSTAAAAAVSFTAISLGVRKAITEYATFDDLLVDVMKTTNLSKDSVKELNQELSEIETRTSQEDLLGLSRIAGKLGYNEISEIAEFVKANNQIIVSLNEDLGGNVEETVNKIGKLVDIFKLKDLYSTEEAFLKVGSALNEQGMASTANEGYMVEFARRMAGVAPLAKVSIDQILGLGAALDQLGQTEEVSSTALSKLFLKLASEAETYSKYAGMKITDFKDLLEKDFMGAFTKVLQGVKNNANGINELTATLGDLSEDGGRVIGVIGSLANNVDLLNSSMDLANKSMLDGTSITNEYELKNQSAAAKLEMAQKQVKTLWIELGEKLWPSMTQGLSLFSMFIKAIKTLVDFVSENWKTITLLTVAITAYTIAVNLNTLAQYANAKATAIATTATRLWNAAIKANPIGLLITAVVTLTTALYLKSKRMSEAEALQKSYNETLSEAKKNVVAETSSIEQNVIVALDKAKADGVRLAAVKRLREIMPAILKDYTDEQIMAGNAKKAIDEYTKSLVKQATVRAMRDRMEKLAQQKFDQQDRQNRGFRGATLGERFESLDAKTFFSNNWANAYNEHVEGNIKTIAAQEKKFAEEIAKLEADISSNIQVVAGTDNDDGNDSIVTKSDSKADSKRRKAYQKELDDVEKHHQNILQQRGLFREDLSELDKLQLIELAKYQEEYQGKLDSIHKRYGESLKTVTNTANQELKKRADAETRYIDSILIKRQTEGEAEKSAYQDRLVKAGLFGIERETMSKRQLDALEVLEREHVTNIAKIDADALAKEIDSRIAANRDMITDLRIQQNDELAEIRTLNDAKEYLSSMLSEKELSQIRTFAQARKAIQNQQMLEEQEILKKQLIELGDILSRAQSSGEFEGLVLSDNVLSEEERKVLVDRIRQVKEELAKLQGMNIGDDLTEKANQERKNVDVLGMSVENWEKMIENLGTTREKITNILGAMSSLTQIWTQYNAMVAAKENAQLQQDESANNKKKENLKKRLDQGSLSQENYNKQIEKMDKEMDRKKAKVARDQAKRERNVALMSAIVNTAKAVTSVLPNFILAAIVGAMGALQIGTIVSTPLPAIPGAEAGGQFMEVVREQDGKKFNARNKPKKRGFISSPTVLVGENGTEWVANAKAVANPSISPIFDVLDTAQKNGRISTMTLSDIISQTMNNKITGKQSGGPISNGTMNNPSQVGTQNNLEMMLQQNINTLKALDKKITNMEVTVALLGKNGFLSKMAELEDNQKNGTL
ncbi:phage tail tape measure protein [Sphingobacterium sp.]|uniref:phage tail tape measure protein n=1 Tax=Sphingobacterium sp. TaxID=341027 RepID=UPI0028A20BE6|nr:phage tail tape measure protein [Sphingobacterium sp.]